MNREQELLEANNRYVENNRKLRSALAKARDQFKFYGEQHRAKQLPDPQEMVKTLEKARVNEALAEEFNQVLDDTSPR